MYRVVRGLELDVGRFANEQIKVYNGTEGYTAEIEWYTPRYRGYAINT